MRPDCLQRASVHEPERYPFRPFVTIHPNHHDLRVSFAQKTFDSEGLESPGPYFSRIIHWPGGNSGVTIGRGYDMGQRTRLQVISELKHAGVAEDEAVFFATAAGLRGERAHRYVQRGVADAPVLSLPAQRRLFEHITTPEVVSDIKRILAKPDLRATYGVTTWEDLTPTAREVVFDLRYRGDYTPETRRKIQPLLVSQDDRGLLAALEDRAYWISRNVPPGRVNARIQIALMSLGYRMAC